MSANDNADPRRFCALHAEGLCDVRVAREKLMCAAHWRMVPVPLQTMVYEAWRSYTQDPTEDTVATLRARQAEATAAVAKKLGCVR